MVALGASSRRSPLGHLRRRRRHQPLLRHQLRHGRRLARRGLPRLRWPIAEPRLRRRPRSHRLPRHRPHSRPRHLRRFALSHLLPSPPTATSRLTPPRTSGPATSPTTQLPQVADPPAGILATANARITPDGYPFPITNDWSDPYRNERIWKLLTGRQGLRPADMLAIQGDIYSDTDRVIAQHLAYAIDHATLGADARSASARPLTSSAAGMAASRSDSPAASIVDAARAALWPLLLTPKLAPEAASAPGSSPPRSHQPWQLYTWGERAFAEEQLIVHTPARWLPPTYATWDDLLAAAVEQGSRRLPRTLPTSSPGATAGSIPSLSSTRSSRSSRLARHRLLGLPTGIHSESSRAATAPPSSRPAAASVHRSASPPTSHDPDAQHPQPRPRRVRQPREPLVPRPVSRLAPRHHLPLAIL